MEVRRRFHYPVRHLPHHGPGPLLPPLCSHSYTAQLPPLDHPEATTSVVRLNHFKLSMQWRGYKPTTLSSEGICAYAQPLLVCRTTESLQPTYPCRDGDLNPQPSHQRELVHALACMTTATWTLVHLVRVILSLFPLLYTLDVVTAVWYPRRTLLHT